MQTEKFRKNSIPPPLLSFTRLLTLFFFRVHGPTWLTSILTFLFSPAAVTPARSLTSPRSLTPRLRLAPGPPGHHARCPRPALITPAEEAHLASPSTTSHTHPRPLPAAGPALPFGHSLRLRRLPALLLRPQLDGQPPCAPHAVSRAAA